MSSVYWCKFRMTLLGACALAQFACTSSDPTGSGASGEGSSGAGSSDPTGSGTSGEGSSGVDSSDPTGSGTSGEGSSGVDSSGPTGSGTSGEGSSGADSSDPTGSGTSGEETGSEGDSSSSGEETGFGGDSSSSTGAGACGSTHPSIGKTATLETHFHGVTGTATIVDDCTIELSNFNFDGQGLDVEIYTGLAGDFVHGLSLTDDLVRSTPYVDEDFVLTLPEGHTLDEVDSMSVWCVDIPVSFGDGVFQ